MADIVERLRALVALRRQAGLHKSSDTEACWLEEAADEIERLRAALPLIEVTPAMQKAGMPSLGKYFFKYEQAANCIKDALTVCAKEGAPDGR